MTAVRISPAQSLQRSRGPVLVGWLSPVTVLDMVLPFGCCGCRPALCGPVICGGPAEHVAGLAVGRSRVVAVRRPVAVTGAVEVPAVAPPAPDAQAGHAVSARVGGQPRALALGLGHVAV